MKFFNASVANGAAMKRTGIVKGRGPARDGIRHRRILNDQSSNLMPVETHDGLNVVYRQHDSDGNVPEQYFTIRWKHFAEALDATVVKPVGSSIYWQLLEMHVADRDASLESLVARITIQRQDLTSTSCPALRRRVDALSKVAISSPTQDIIVLHPLVRRIVIDGGGGSIDASLYEDEHPLARWAEPTFEVLSRCTTIR